MACHRGTLLSDPRHDRVCCVVVSILHDWMPVPDGEAQETHVLVVEDVDLHAGSVLGTADSNPQAAVEGQAGVPEPPAVGTKEGPAARPAYTPGSSAGPAGGSLGLHGVHWHFCATEAAALEELALLVRAQDPDILLSWEVQRTGLGYLVDRATALDMSLTQMLSRTPEVAVLLCCVSLSTWWKVESRCLVGYIRSVVSALTWIKPMRWNEQTQHHALKKSHPQKQPTHQQHDHQLQNVSYSVHTNHLHRWQALGRGPTMPTADCTLQAFTSQAASLSTCGGCCAPTSS